MKNPTLVFFLLLAGVVFCTVCMVCAGTLAHAQGGTKQPMAPNNYEFSGGPLQAGYTSSSINGQPHFTYKDGAQTLSFSGNQIRTAQTEIGTLVTVTTRMTVDSGSTTFTLLLPTVNLATQGTRVEVHTYGITTVHRFSVVPKMNEGQTETYTVTELSGTASLVMF
jgi:hypothetical protein